MIAAQMDGEATSRERAFLCHHLPLDKLHSYPSWVEDDGGLLKSTTITRQNVHLQNRGITQHRGKHSYSLSLPLSEKRGGGPLALGRNACTILDLDQARGTAMMTRIKKLKPLLHPLRGLRTCEYMFLILNYPALYCTRTNSSAQIMARRHLPSFLPSFLSPHRARYVMIVSLARTTGPLSLSSFFSRLDHDIIKEYRLMILSDYTCTRKV